MKIYTRTGDKGETSLIGGRRVSKAHPRLEAVGALDELNALLGVLGLHVSGQSDVEDFISCVQRDLFTLGAAVANPNHGADCGPAPERKLERSLEMMELDIDRLCSMAPELKSFVIPSGSPAAVHAHHARTVCRRAERTVAALLFQGSGGDRNLTEPGSEADLERGSCEWVVAYLNRLNDWLFALARALNCSV